MIIIIIYLYVCVCMFAYVWAQCVCGHTSHYMCVEVRGQLYGVGFLFLPLCELLGQCQAARLVGQVLLCIEPSHQLLVVIYICL